MFTKMDSIDSFEFLSREIFSIFSSVRDEFALVGAAYITKTAICCMTTLWELFKVHCIAQYCRPDLVKKYGSWAVVTGSTHGIGKAYAQELANHGVNIVIVSLGEEDCRITANYLGATFGVKTLIVPVDFHEGRPVYERIWKEIKDLEIGILVNNVGVMYEYPQYFLEVADERLWQLVHVNVAAATMMTKMILPQMVKRGRGAVVTVSAGGCCMPTPLMTVYSATKAYVDYFSRALSHEYGSKGITIQCLIPYFVATRMTEFSPTLSNPSLLIPTATTYARHALSTLGWSDRTTGYWPHTIQSWIVAFIPLRLWLWASTRLNYAFQRQAVQRRRRHRTGSKHVSRPSSWLIPDHRADTV